MIKEINKTEIEFSALSFADDVGMVFYWDGRIFRAVKQEAAEKVKELFFCGLVDELVENNIFPKSWITDYSLEGFGLVVEHERYFPVTYPYEWSFSMLQDAAITVLEVNIIARKYGYQTKDCHGFNVIFDGVYAKFVDLGSFFKVAGDIRGWLAFDEFLGFYYYPLLVWRDGNNYIARKMLLGGMTMPHVSYLLYKFPICRMINLSWLEKTTRLFSKLKTYSHDISVSGKNGFAINLAIRMAKKNLLPFMKVDLHSWLKKIRKLSLKRYATMWGGYHDKFYQDGTILSTPRFDRVVSIIKDLKPSSILELAGNQGILSMLLAGELPKIPVICTDYDEIAVDAMCRKIKQRNVRLSPALLDFVFPTLTPYGQNPSDRLRAEVVIALAVTHHLILTESMPIDYIFRILSSYTKKYLLVEFMPLGLHDGTSAPPLPDWYSVDWFRGNFTKHYYILQEVKLEENRILFVGKLK